jgi:hypothetical protein
MKYSNALAHTAHRQGLANSRARALGLGVTVGLASLLACAAAWGQDDPVQQRRQELRSTVRQQRADGVATVNYNKQASSGTDSKAAGPVNLRHLTAEERTELRRQLARDLRAQRSPGNASQ